ncbi:MAG TPA: RDD family protein [Alphaproteobacteria bacterium]|nr:RDD family protein [Alphaproteobacteria bacterium]
MNGPETTMQAARPIGSGSPLARWIETPEGVVLPIELGQRGERAVAFILDFLIVFGIIIGLYLLLLAVILGGKFGGIGWLFALVMLASFFIRSFYFAFFELRWQGTTPGKRAMGLRVIDRAGGPLTPQAVLGRNLMREVEVFLPIMVLISGTFSGEVWQTLATIGWLAVFMFMPLLNRDGLRVGDMIAGTWVVAAPKGALMRDLAHDEAAEAQSPSHYSFTTKQLDAYGIYELQTLEGVLRDRRPNAGEVRAEVARRIRAKIEMPEEDPADPDTERFLRDFYTAMRARLERRMLLGVRRRDKHDRR